jgi:hypothetical protein
MICVGLAYWRFERRDIRVTGEGSIPWRRFAIGTAVALAAIAVPVVLALQPKKHGSPQEALDAALTALETDDRETFVSSLTPEAIDEWNAHFVLFGAMLQKGEKTLESQMPKAGDKVSMEQMVLFFSMIGKFRSAMKLVDAERLKDYDRDITTAMFSVMLTRKLPPLTPKQRELARLVKEPEKFLNKALRAWLVAFHYGDRLQLDNLEVDGDKARGQLVGNGAAMNVTFEKVNGSWRVALPFLAGELRETKTTSSHKKPGV